MKSLKRTLSLVLVLVMVLGLVGISAGASFKDEAKINYKEAVGVMTGIGALVGYPDGTFNGTGTVTREEAVKTVVYSVLGADIAKTLAGTATGFADVDAGRWSSGVIAYAVSKGIINGRDAKTFDPTGNVTANEVGKMMLCAAGYGAKGEFIGSSWELNTAVMANKIGLYAGSKATNYSAPATREEVALYTFNGIMYSPIANETTTTTRYVITATATADAALKTLSGTDYATFAEAKDKGTNAAKANNVYGIDFTVAPITVTSQTSKGSIASTVYDLAKISGVTDSFGRPATNYTMASKKIASFPKLPVVTFTGPFTKGALYTALGEAVANIPVTVNSEAKQAAGTALVAAIGLNTPTDVQGANGVITEVYKTGTGTYSAIQIVPQLGKVSAVKPTKATSTAGAYATYTVTDGTTPLSGKVYSTVVDKAADIDTASITGAIALDAPVLYYKDGQDKVYIQAVGTMTGVLTSVSNTNVLTIDGKTYKLAEAGTAPTANTKPQTFLVDSYGNILKSITAQIGTNFGLILDEKTVYALGTDNTMKPTNVVLVATADGTVQTLPVALLPDLKGKLVTYAVNPAVIATTQYTITDVASADTYKEFASDVKAITSKAPLLDVGFAIAKTASTAATAKYADATTLFVVANFDALGAPTGTVTTYTGIGNVPSYDTLTGVAYAVDTAKVADGVANVVYIYKNLNASSASKMVYIIGTYTDTATARVYDTIIDGKPGTISVAKGNTDLTASAGKLLTKVTVDSAGAPTAGAEATAVTNQIGIKVSGGLLYTTVNGSDFVVYDTVPNVADTTPVFVIHTASRTCDTLTGATAGTIAAAGAKVVVVPNTTVTNTAAAIYVLIAD